MTNPQEQFTELTRRTQENFKHLWEQWSQRSNELLKGVTGRSRPTGEAPGNPEEVLDAVFDFAENLIAQQRAFAKQMLREHLYTWVLPASSRSPYLEQPAPGRTVHKRAVGPRRPAGMRDRYAQVRSATGRTTL